MDHECPADGCAKLVDASMLMCAPHWYMVPKHLRSAVWRAWNRGAGARTPAHTAAIMAAIDSVNMQLGGARNESH
jgi:hypothetical protein